ncbi:hypothetical protein [Microbulbifer sp. 2205BS26-8]|uniref:hypothetical protein n=1 Tax=Microbulbifer sp. 2205BS26-8 TaxID=3064386 RepID=UPI00273FA6B0|nr:hypothetical protein [Microbulbifer sp. 2205BS26-8]MDP5211176.1 hypothetical protein [Microbulbifer sp. 2205BS26-8]
MRFKSARQAWHDALDSPTTAFDYEAIAGKSTAVTGSRRRLKTVLRDDEGKVICRLPAPRTEASETLVGKGSAGRIMDACEKGMVQSVIAQVRRDDPLAYCWGMAAYAPPALRFKERAALLHYLMGEFDQWGEPHDRTQVSKLALFCITACALRDVNGRHIDLKQARTLLRCDKIIWDKHWKRLWQRLQRRLDPLPMRALGPISQVVEDYKKRLCPDG